MKAYVVRKHEKESTLDYEVYEIVYEDDDVVRPKFKSLVYTTPDLADALQYAFNENENSGFNDFLAMM